MILSQYIVRPTGFAVLYELGFMTVLMSTLPNLKALTRDFRRVAISNKEKHRQEYDTLI